VRLRTFDQGSQDLLKCNTINLLVSSVSDKLECSLFAIENKQDSSHVLPNKR